MRNGDVAELHLYGGGTIEALLATSQVVAFRDRRNM